MSDLPHIRSTDSDVAPIEKAASLVGLLNIVFAWLACAALVGFCALIFFLTSCDAYAALGDNFRVDSYVLRPGAVTYTWDRAGETIDTTYTIRRGGVIVRQSSPATIVNGNDAILFYGETYQVTLQVNDGPESAPISVSLPAPPTPPTGGNLLYVVLNFTDKSHAPLASDFEATIARNAAWMGNVSGGLVQWQPTIISVTMTEPYIAYTYSDWGLPDLGNTDKVIAELAQRLDLSAVHRMLIDVQGFSAFPQNSGAPIGSSDTWAVWVNSRNFPHEILHTYGLWHYGYLPSLPADIDQIPGTQSFWSGEVMGTGQSPDRISLLNMLMLGIRHPEQIYRVPAGGATVVLTDAESTTGLQGALIPLTAGGAAYMIEYWPPYIHVVLRPTVGAGGISLWQVGFGQSGRIFTDPSRSVTVDVVATDPDTATVRIVTPAGRPPPQTASVTILTPRDGLIVPRKSSTTLSGATNPAGLPITWSATCGAIVGSLWQAPGAPNKSCRITATSGAASDSVTVKTGPR